MTAHKLPSTAEALLLRAIEAGGDLSPKALAEASGKPANNIARDLDSLAKAGWIAPREAGMHPVLIPAGRDTLAALDRFEGKAAAEGPTGAEVRLDLIDEDPLVQPRKHFDEDELESLAGTIRDKGVIQPIRLRQSANPGDGRYRIVAGERRVRAARLAGLATIPFVYRELTDDQAIEIAMLENIQRVDMNPIEEAEGFKAIIAAKMRGNPDLELKDAKEIIAEATRKTPRYVEQRLDLLVLPAGVQLKVAGGEMGLSQARDAVQNLRAIEKRIKERTLAPAELLVVAELVDKLEKSPVDLKTHSWSGPDIWTEIDYMVDGFYIAETYIADKPTKGLAWALATRNIIEIKGHEDGRTFARLSGWAFSKDDLKAQLPALFGKATRIPALATLRDQVLGEAAWPGRPTDRYATEWLNGPMKPEPERAQAWALVQAERAEQAAAQAAADKVREDERAAELASADADKGEEGRQFLQAVMALEAAAEAGLAQAEVQTTLQGLFAQRGIQPPFRVAWDDRARTVVRHDANGKPLMAASAAFEGVMRLINLSMNLAVGAAPSQPEELPAPWSAYATTPAETEAQWIGWIADRLETAHGVTDPDMRAALAEGFYRSTRADCAFGEAGASWSRKAADDLTDGEVETIVDDEELTLEEVADSFRAQLALGDEDAAADDAGDEETPAYLARLAGAQREDA